LENQNVKNTESCICKFRQGFVAIVTAYANKQSQSKYTYTRPQDERMIKFSFFEIFTNPTFFWRLNMNVKMALTLMGAFSLTLLEGNLLAVQHASPASAPEALLAITQDEGVAQQYLSYAIAGEQANTSQSAVNKALKALKNAEDDAAKRTAEGELKTALEADYDSRLEGYEKHLDELEKELAKMRDQLQKRRMAKSEMVNLRLQVLKAEADDLGWPSETGARGQYRVFRGNNPFGTTWSSGFAPGTATVPSAPAVPTVLGDRVPAPSARSSGGR
jgi:hypothetical protein